MSFLEVIGIDAECIDCAWTRVVETLEKMHLIDKAEEIEERAKQDTHLYLAEAIECGTDDFELTSAIIKCMYASAKYIIEEEYPELFGSYGSVKIETYINGDDSRFSVLDYDNRFAAFVYVDFDEDAVKLLKANVFDKLNCSGIEFSTAEVCELVDDEDFEHIMDICNDSDLTRSGKQFFARSFDGYESVDALGVYFADDFPEIKSDSARGRHIIDTEHDAIIHEFSTGKVLIIRGERFE